MTIQKDQWKTKWMLAVLFFIPLYISFTAEWVNKQNAGQVYDWIMLHFDYFMIDVLLITGVFFMLYGLLNRVLFSFILEFVIICTLSAVSYYKMALRGEPLYASDLSMALEMTSVSSGSNLILTNARDAKEILVSDYIYYILFFIILLIAAIYWLRMQKIRLSFPRRFTVSAMGIAVVLVIYCSGAFKTNHWNDFTYSKKGFSLGFFSNIQYCLADEIFQVGTPRYTEEYLTETVQALKMKYQPSLKNETEKQPNVIVVMSESFFDITRIENLALSEDPIPNYHELIKNHIHGNMGSITFGGGTANVEYEFLTGFLNRYFSSIHSSYETSVQRPVMSLATIFKEKGYETVALHTYNKSFYERDRVYPLLGFDRFIGLEDWTEPLVYDGFYVSDSVLTDMIIDEYEKKDGPVFMFAVSMENHQPYNDQKYGENSIQVMNGDMKTSLKNSVEAYVHGLNSADRELQRLVDYFSESGEETCILFFGDHLPTLGPEFEFYRNMGVIEKKSEFSPEELKPLLSTQFLLWTNYLEMNTDSSEIGQTEEIELLGSNFLGSTLLDVLGMKKPLFYHFISMVQEKTFYMSRYDFFAGVDGSLHEELPSDFLELDELYKMFQYDMLLGEDYVTESLKEFR